MIHISNSKIKNIYTLRDSSNYKKIIILINFAFLPKSNEKFEHTKLHTLNSPILHKTHHIICHLKLYLLLQSLMNFVPNIIILMDTHLTSNLNILSQMNPSSKSKHLLNNTKWHPQTVIERWRHRRTLFWKWYECV